MRIAILIEQKRLKIVAKNWQLPGAVLNMKAGESSRELALRKMIAFILNDMLTLLSDEGIT